MIDGGNQNNSNSIPSQNPFSYGYDDSNHSHRDHSGIGGDVVDDVEFHEIDNILFVHHLGFGVVFATTGGSRRGSCHCQLMLEQGDRDLLSKQVEYIWIAPRSDEYGQVGTRLCVDEHPIPQLRQGKQRCAQDQKSLTSSSVRHSVCVFQPTVLQFLFAQRFCMGN